MGQKIFVPAFFLSYFGRKNSGLVFHDIKADYFYFRDTFLEMGSVE